MIPHDTTEVPYGLTASGLPQGILWVYTLNIEGPTRPFYSTLALFFVLPLGLFVGKPLPATWPAGRTTLLIEAAHATLAASDHDHTGAESAQSRPGKRRAWAHRANLAKVWHEESATKWITSYAAQLSPRSTSPPPLERPSTGNDPSEIPSDPDAPGGEVYETVKQLMKLQNLEGDHRTSFRATKRSSRQSPRCA